MAGSPDTRSLLMLALLLAAGVAGHGAWLWAVDTGPAPFLPADAAQARRDVQEAFPNATAPTAHVVLEAGPGGSVLSAEGLTVLAGLHSRISSSETIAPVLAPEEPLSSVLEPLAPHLEGEAGEWDQERVRSALENVTRTTEGRRALSLFLGQDAVLEGARSRANVTVLVVRFDASAPSERLEEAQERLHAIADASRVAGFATWTTSPEALQDAARSPWGLWVPVAAVALVIGGGLLVGWGPLRTGRWALTWLGAAGTGLLVGWAVDQITPLALAAAHLGAALGLAGAMAAPERPWVGLASALPVALLIGWAPAGVGGLALVATAAVVVAPASIWLAPRLTARSEGEDQTREAGPGVPLGALGALLLVGALLVLAFGGLPQSAVPGWEGQVPSRTGPGHAEAVLEEDFQGPGPAAPFTVAAWGPVSEPGFLQALDESGERLGRLSLTGNAGQAQSVLSLARDWATDSGEPGDAFDPDFATLWDDAAEDGVPVRDVARVLAALQRLAPVEYQATVAAGPDGAATAASLRQRIDLADVVPRPTEAVEAAIQPLVAASERVAVTGPALAAGQTRAALLDAQPNVLAAQVIGAVLAALAWAFARRPPAAALAAATGAALAAVLATAAGMRLAEVAASPATLLAPGMAAAAAWLVLAPALARASAEPDVPWIVRPAGWAAQAVPLGAVTVALVSAPTPGFQLAGAATVLALLSAAAFVLLLYPGLAGAWWPTGPTAAGPGAARAHTACRVCQRTTVTAAARCRRCSQWNLLEACPAHPDAHDAHCVACDRPLERPQFG